MTLRLEGVELVRVETPFRVDIGTAAGVHRIRSLLFVRVVAEEGQGRGECVALREGTAVDPGVDEVDAGVRTRGLSQLFEATAARGGHLPSPNEIAALFGPAPVDRMMGALFEMAVADAELRLAGRSLAEALEVAPDFETLPVGAAVGIPPGYDLGQLRAQVTAAVADGVARVRVKIEPGWDVVPVAALRADHPDLVLQVDANGSYRMDDAAQVERLAAYEVRCIEQPLPADDLEAHAEFARRVSVPICLDESLSSPGRVLSALRQRSCAVACLKPGRLGGLAATRSVHAACVAAGVPVFVGGFFEAGLGRAANLALAARLAQDAVGLIGDLSAPRSYLEVDPCGPDGYPPVRQGRVGVPTRPGVGEGPHQATLDGLGARRHWFPAT